MKNQQNSISSRYQSNYNSISPIRPTTNCNENISNDYNPFYQADNIFNKPFKSPKILWNNEGKPVSTIEYIKSQKDIEHLDFINTLIRLKTGNSNSESSMLNHHHNIISNTQYNVGPSFPKESSTIAVNTDDSKSYIKEILDICGECPSEQSPKTSQGLKRNDLIEITNRRKRMADMPINDVHSSKKPIEEIDINNNEKNINEIQPREINEYSQRKMNNDKIIRTDNKKSQAQAENENNSITKPSNKNSNINNDHRINESKSFNNQRNIKQIEDMLKETKKIETAMISKQGKKINSNNNRQIKEISDENLISKPNIIAEEGEENKKQHSVDKAGKQYIKERNDSKKRNNSIHSQKEENEELKPNKDNHSNKENKSELPKKQKALKSKRNHKTSLSSNSNTSIIKAHGNAEDSNSSKFNKIEIESSDIKLKNEQGKDTSNDILLQKKLGELFSNNHNYYSNLLALPINNELKNKKISDLPQEKNNDELINNESEEEASLVKAEINLFEGEEEGELNNSPKRTPKDNKSNKMLSKIVQSIQPITENQIEFDIDELLHPKYLFKTANNAVNSINSKTKSTQIVKTTQKRNSVPISNTEQPFTEKEKTISKNDNFKAHHLTKINTTKVLPTYSKQKQKSNVDQMILTTSPSKPIQNVSKTPTSKQTNSKKKKFTFEPRKVKDMTSVSENCLVQLDNFPSQRNPKTENNKQNKTKPIDNNTANILGGNFK